jgi:nucleoside-diphosphate-sugar epimerase
VPLLDNQDWQEGGHIMRIVITGASGNIGTALLRRLACDGNDLVGLARRTPPNVEPYAGVRWVRLDLGLPDAATRLTDECAGADAVVHLAWLIQPSHDRNLLRRTNQGGTRAVVRAVGQAGVAHLVHMSSVAAYAGAPRGLRVGESWPTTGVPTSSYSVDKSACERLVAGAADVTTIVRPTLVLQPDAASEISRYFLSSLVPVSVLHPALYRFAPWPRELQLQFVHAADVADALASILQLRASGPFNLAADPVIDRDAVRRLFGGSGPPLPMHLIRTAATATWRARLQPVDGGWVDLGAAAPLLRSDRARDELGWQPTHSAESTLMEFVHALWERRGHAGPLLHSRRW